MNEKLKKLIEEIKNNTDIGFPSYHYPIHNHKVTSVYNVPFEKKPITTLLQQLNIHVEADGLRSQGNLHSLQKSELIIPSISDDNHTASLSLDHCKHLLETAKIYLNTDVGINEEHHKRLLPKSNHDANEILKFSEEQKYQSNSICHAQEISLLTSFKACQSKTKLTSRFVGLPQAGTVVSNNLWLLSTPEFHFPKNNEIDTEKYLMNMLHILFHAATQEHCEFLIIPALDFGHHKAHNELFYTALIRVAKFYPSLNIIYSPAHQQKELKKRIKEEQCENVATTEKDVLAIAAYLQKNEHKTALYNPTTLEAVYGYADIGCYWQYRNKFGKSLSAILGNISTCVLNSHGINPEAFNRVHTFSLINKPAEAELKDSSDSDSFTTASDASNPISDEEKDSIEPPLQETTKEKQEPEVTAIPEIPSEPEAASAELAHDNLDNHQEVPTPVLPLPASQPSSPPISPRNGFFPLAGTSESSSAPTDLIERLSDDQITKIQLHINKLEREYNSCWPDLYKTRKLDKADALKQLLEDANNMSLAKALQTARTKASVTAGFFSRRTKNLLDELEGSIIFRQKI